MFFITGDTHAHIDIRKLNTENFPIQRELTRDDYVVICGDFGLVWDGGKSDKWWQEWLFDKPFTTLFVDGNHENHDLLEQYPVSEWNGGKVHFIQPNVIHLMRGQVYDIDGVRFFTMGGAASHDKEFRQEGISWWAKEMPSAEEYAEAERNLEAVGWKVDYVLTHDAPTSIQAYLGAGKYVADELNAFLERLLERIEFKQWFFGHYHQDVSMGMYRAIYRDIVLVEQEKQKMFFGQVVDELKAEKDCSREYYHVTLAENVPSIRENGLVPQVGERSEEFGETERQIFLFPTKNDMNNALYNWLGEWYNENYGEDCELAIVRVEIPAGITVEYNGVGYERVCREVIPPKCLSFFDEKGNALFLNSLETVDEKIEGAMDVLEALEQYEGFLRDQDLEKG